MEFYSFFPANLAAFTNFHATAKMGVLLAYLLLASGLLLKYAKP